MGPGFLAAGRAAVARHLDQTGDGDARDAGGAGGALRAGELLPAAVLSGFTALLHHCHDLAGTKRSGARRMAGDGRPVSVLGVPTSAGSHNPGQEKAPAAWRAAGLIGELQAAGLDVEDRGDLEAAPYRPVEPDGGLRDTDRVAEVVRRVAAEVAAIRAAGRRPLVLGGDCTITLGALDGFGDGGLVYFDGDADLNPPERSDSAVADTMGMTHMLGGGSARLARLGSRYPLLRPGQVVLFGFDPAELDTGQWTELASRHLYAAPAPAVRADPAGEGRAALLPLPPPGRRLPVALDRGRR